MLYVDSVTMHHRYIIPSTTLLIGALNDQGYSYGDREHVRAGTYMVENAIHDLGKKVMLPELKS